MSGYASFDWQLLPFAPFMSRWMGTFWETIDGWCFPLSSIKGWQLLTPSITVGAGLLAKLKRSGLFSGRVDKFGLANSIDGFWLMAELAVVLFVCCCLLIEELRQSIDFAGGGGKFGGMMSSTGLLPLTRFTSPINTSFCESLFKLDRKVYSGGVLNGKRFSLEIQLKIFSSPPLAPRTTVKSWWD